MSAAGAAVVAAGAAVVTSAGLLEPPHPESRDAAIAAPNITLKVFFLIIRKPP